MATKPWQDAELKNLFKQQKATEARFTPDFDAMWEETLQESQIKKKSKWRFSLVAAGLLLALNVGIYHIAQRSPSRTMPTARISQWQAPTKVLLPSNTTQEITQQNKASTSPQQVNYSISDWQPPSDALLPVNTVSYY